MERPPRCAVVLTHNRPTLLEHCVAALSTQVDWLVVVDNASDPPANVSPERPFTGEGVDRFEIVREPAQPPNLAKMWNAELNRIADVMSLRGEEAWDVALVCDDVIAPPGWYECVSQAMRSTGASAASTHSYHPTGTYVLRDLTNGTDRMCPWAFVLRGEHEIRADESLRWWYCDTDLDWQARRKGGTCVASGPIANNERIGEWTALKPELGAQTHTDGQKFAAKWGV